MKYENIKKMKCNNPNSKWKGVLNDNVILKGFPINVVFNMEDENCFFPIQSSLEELVSDGWEILEV